LRKNSGKGPNFMRFSEIPEDFERGFGVSVQWR
jgi:hypothetical protein